MAQIKLGDIFELETSKGKAHIQYMEQPKDKTEVEKVRVFYTLHKKGTIDLNEIIKGDFFYICFAVKAALNNGIIKRIGNLPVNDFKYPTKFRTEHIFKKGCWQIVDSKTLYRESVEKLNDEQQKLSPWGIWNDTLLKQRLEEGWNLKNWI